jgi:hypothetical protein
MTEKFKKTWQNHVKSSLGYEFWIVSPGSLKYVDAEGYLMINSEWLLYAPGTSVLIRQGSIPDTPNRSQELVVDRIRRGAAFAGWNVEFVA